MRNGKRATVMDRDVGMRSEIDCLRAFENDPAYFRRMTSVWNEFYHGPADGSRDMLSRHHGVHIARDSGVSDIPELDYAFMYLKAQAVCALVVINVLTVIHTDVMALHEIQAARVEGAGERFLLSKQLLRLLGFESVYTHQFDKCIPLLELLLLGFLGVRFLFFISAACLFAYTQDEFSRWLRTADVFWTSVPELQSFSLIRLLHYVTPTVMRAHALRKLRKAFERFARHRSLRSRIITALPVLRYCLMCCCCLLLGFDAFLIKSRVVRECLVGDGFDWGNFFQILVYLYQVSGIVSINWIVRERLFIFIFGGELGRPSNDDKILFEVWSTMLAKEIYTEHGYLVGTVVMLGFDDFDFQLLVLDDKRKPDKMSARSCCGSPKRFLRSGFSPMLPAGCDPDGGPAEAGAKCREPRCSAPPPPEAAGRGEGAAHPQDGPRLGGAAIPAPRLDVLRQPLLGDSPCGGRGSTAASSESGPEAGGRGEGAAHPQDGPRLGGAAVPAARLDDLRQPLLGGSSGGRGSTAASSESGPEAACRGEGAAHPQDGPRLGGAAVPAARLDPTSPRRLLEEGLQCSPGSPALRQGRPRAPARPSPPSHLLPPRPPRRPAAASPPLPSPIRLQRA